MQLVSETAPRERLLTSIESEPNHFASGGSAEPHAPASDGAFSSNSWWMLIGAVIGATLLSGGVLLFGFFPHKNGHAEWPTFIKARTRSLAAGPETDATPPPIIVQLSPEMVRVTSISLGHPRLAVINGQTFAEGDPVTVSKSNDSVALTLRIVRILDGRIDLTDGRNFFSARIAIVGADQLKPH